MPTNWIIGAAGLTIEILSISPGTVAGGKATVLRVRMHGTTTSTNGAIQYATSAVTTGAGFNQPISQSLYLALVAGSLAPVNPVHWMQILDATGAVVVDIQPSIKSLITNTLTQVSRVTTTPASGNAPFYTVFAAVLLYWASGAAVDLTLDIAAPQVEFGTVPTAFIPTTAGPVTRGAGTTNLISNSSMTGAVTGTPGTLPTAWGDSIGGGMSRQVVALGTDAVTGLHYMDIRYFGTSSSTLTNLHIGSVASATVGATLATSVYLAPVAGSTTGVTFNFGVQETDSTGAFLGFSAGCGNLAMPNTGAISRGRLVGGGTTSHATCFTISPSLWIQYGSGLALDFTIRIMAPQVEGGSFASAPIPSTGTLAYRAPTYGVTRLPTTLNEPAATNYYLSSQTATATNWTTTVSTDVPVICGSIPVWLHKAGPSATLTAVAAMAATGLPSAGSTVRGSMWVWLPAQLAPRTAVSVFVGSASGNGAPTNLDLTKNGQWQRVSATATLGAGVTAAQLVLETSTVSPGDVFYTSAWQMEIDTGAPTTYMPWTTTPQMRAADLIYTARAIFIDPPYSSLQPAFNGVAGSWTLDDKTLTIPLRDASYWLERPLLRSTYAGSGQYEGTTALGGTLKPLAIGAEPGGGGIPGYGILNVTPVLIDPAALIYHFSDGGGVIQALYEGGYTGGITNAGDVADLYVGSTPSGQYRTCGVKGCFQLGSTPVYAITCDVIGRTSSGVPVGDVLSVAYYALVNICGMPPELIGSTVDGRGATVLAQVGPSPLTYLTGRNGCGVFLGPNDNPQGVDLMTRLLAPVGLKLVTCRDGKLRGFLLAALPGSPTIKATLNSRTVVDITLQSLPADVDPPPYRVRVGYNDNYTVQTSAISPLAAAARVQYLASTGSISQANSTNLTAAIARPNDPPLITGSIVRPQVGSAASVALATATELAALWGVRRRLYAITVPFSVGVVLDYGDVVTVTLPFDDLTGGKNGQVVGYSYRSADATIILKVLV